MTVSLQPRLNQPATPLPASNPAPTSPTMATLEWLLLTTLPLVPADGVSLPGSPAQAIGSAYAETALGTASWAWRKAVLARQADQDVIESGSDAEMPPGSGPGQMVVYQSETEPDSAGTATMPLPALTMGRGEFKNAARLDDLTLPTPDELYTAIGRGRRINWQTYYRAPGAVGFRTRPQVAANLGIVIADAYMAIEARDGLYSQSMTQDLLTLASALGMSQAQLARGQSLLRFATEGEWPVLRTELEAMENEIKTALVQQRDAPLVDVISLGCWLRALQIASGSVRDAYTPERAAIMRQPELLFWLDERAGALPTRVAQEKVVERLRECIREIKPFLVFDARTPPTELETEKLNRLLGRFMKRAITR